MYAPKKRVFRIVNHNRFQKTLQECLEHGQNIFYVMSVATTGIPSMNNEPDEFTPEITKFCVNRCEYKNGVLTDTGFWTSLVKPAHPIPEKIEELTGITNEMVKHAPSIDEVFLQLYELIEPNANIIGYNVDKFLIPMLTYSGFHSGIMLYDMRCLDLMELATALVPMPSRKKGAYSLASVVAQLKLGDFHIGTPDGNQKALIALFNRLVPDLPKGKDRVTITGTPNYWNKYGYDSSCLFVGTSRGQISINHHTAFLQEDTPGYFDSVDLEAFVNDLRSKYGGKTLYEICDMFEAKKKAQS